MNACAIQRPIAPRTAIRLLAVGLAIGVLSSALPARAAFPGASGAAGVMPVAVTAVPLLLAGLTGVAKTTTA
jgi:hypothetical protein